MPVGTHFRSRSRRSRSTLTRPRTSNRRRPMKSRPALGGYARRRGAFGRNRR